MPEIIVCDGGQKEIDRLEIKINEIVDKILNYVPKNELINLQYVYVKGLPTDTKYKKLLKVRIPV